jgi:hypothetical protein
MRRQNSKHGFMYEGIREDDESYLSVAQIQWKHLRKLMTSSSLLWSHLIRIALRSVSFMGIKWTKFQCQLGWFFISDMTSILYEYTKLSVSDRGKKLCWQRQEIQVLHYWTITTEVIHFRWVWVMVIYACDKSLETVSKGANTVFPC